MERHFFEKNADYFYFAFRVIVGVLFILHGWMKLQGIMGGNMQIMSLMGLAMLIEILGGLFIVVGFLTRWTALIAAIEMVVAYFMSHFPNGISPLANRGEPALLFFAAFLVLIAFGARKWCVDRK